MKKFLTTCLALAVFALTGFVGIGSVSADSDEVKLNDGVAQSLATAVTSAKTTGGTIVLQKDVTLGSVVDIEADAGKTITIDLNGFNITNSSTDRVFNVKSGVVKIVNNGDATKGKIVNENTSSTAGVIFVKGSDDEVESQTDLTIGKNVTVEGINPVIVGLLSGSKQVNYGTKVTIEGTLNNTKSQSVAGAALTIHGTIKNTTYAPIIDIKDGAVLTSGLSDGTGIYQAGYSVITAGKATISGSTGIITKSGALTLNGTKVTGTLEEAFEGEAAGSGFASTGAAIQIESNNPPYAGLIDLNINGGEYTSTSNSAILEYKDEDDEESTAINTIAINAGTFISAEGQDDIKGVVKTSFIKGGSFSSDVTKYVAEGYKLQNGKVIDPNAVTSTTVTGKGDTTKNPKTGDNAMLYFVLAILGVGVVGVSAKKVFTK